MAISGLHMIRFLAGQRTCKGPSLLCVHPFRRDLRIGQDYVLLTLC